MPQNIKKFITKNKIALLFLVKFFGVYGVFTFLYSLYLSADPQSIDPFSALVAEQTNIVIGFFHEGLWLNYLENTPRILMMHYYHPYQAIVEGCNALSVMILFIAFIVAFKAPVYHYFWYIPFGLFTLHVFNITRITLLGLSYLHFPEYAVMLHDYAFPAVIYGVTMTLWFIWVKFIVK